jgi:predicted HicB family RNase H-like nuclease
VLNTRATLYFAGRTVEELRTAFTDTIEDYRDWCKAEGKEPEKPYSGTLSLRIAPELHRRVAALAVRKGKSINAVIGEALEGAV